jgi:hypothetical protein
MGRDFNRCGSVCPAPGDSDPAEIWVMAWAETGAGGSAVGKRSAKAGQSKPAGSGTAAKHIHDQVKKGNIRLQGATDADIYQ